ncbi:MAG: hypothetical protein ACREF3_13725 [Acetobacteraceae bacterium]
MPQSSVAWNRSVQAAEGAFTARSAGATMTKSLRLTFIAAGSAGLLALAPTSFAATQATGVTSGPAAHSNTTPNTAVTKDMNTAQANTNGASETGNAAVGAGAPGTNGKPGTEAGHATQTKQP